jgi:hypothetical protein
MSLGRIDGVNTGVGKVSVDGIVEETNTTGFNLVGTEFSKGCRAVGDLVGTEASEDGSIVGIIFFLVDDLFFISML